MASNTDLDYVKKFRETPEAKKTPAFINWKGDNQYIWVYSRNGFTQGAYWGAYPAICTAIYTRRLRHLVLQPLAFGLAYASFHASSAYFRNEI